MRLWQKIFLAALALMVLSTTLLSILLLKNSRDALWQREYQRVVTQQQYLAGMLRAGVISHRLQLGQVLLEEGDTRQTAVQVLSQQVADSYLSGLTLLDSGGEVLYDTMPRGLDNIPSPAPDEPNATVWELRRGSGDEEGKAVRQLSSHGSGLLHETFSGGSKAGGTAAGRTV